LAYRDDILALNPDALFPFDGNLTEVQSTSDATGTGVSYTTPVPCEDMTSAMTFNSTDDNVSGGGLGLVDTRGTFTRKAVCGWIELTDIQGPPKNIVREGSNGDNQYNIVLWAGNNLMFDVVTNGSVIQAFSDRVITPNRSFHVFTRVEGTGFGNKVELYLDGVRQSLTEPTSGELGTVNLAARTIHVWGSVTSTEVGGESVGLNAGVTIRHGMWAYFSEANAQLSDTQIREELFEKGALPGTTITTGTEAAMQLQLDGLALSQRGDEPLNIRVETVTGDGTLNLTADDITHDPQASIHVQYMGTGTLNWTNTNGSNASIGSTPNGGTINFINPATLTLSPLITDSEVRIYEAGTTTEIAGIESSGTSFSTSIGTNSVDVIIHKEDYEYIRLLGIDTSSGDVSVPVAQQFDRNYENL
jgi:hypothetical protein